MNNERKLKSFHKDLDKIEKQIVIPANTLKVGDIMKFGDPIREQNKVLSADNQNNQKHHVCSECNKSLSNGNGSVVIYKPQSAGPTQTQPNGFKCSKECYDKAITKK